MTLKQQHEYYWVRTDASGFVQFDTIIEATVTAGAITQNIVTANRTPEQIEKAQSLNIHMIVTQIGIPCIHQQH